MDTNILFIPGNRPDPRVVAPTLYIMLEAWLQLQRYVRESEPNEINGFGLIEFYEGDFYLRKAADVLILEQEVSPGSADNTGSAYAKLFYRVSEEGRGENLRLQWHSHVRGGAYMSATDMANIANLGASGAHWMVGVVMNVYGQVEARLDVFQGFRIGTPIDVAVIVDADWDADEAVRRQIDELVTVVEPNKDSPLAALFKQVDEQPNALDSSSN